MRLRQFYVRNLSILCKENRFCCCYCCFCCSHCCCCSAAASIPIVGRALTQLLQICLFRLYFELLCLLLFSFCLSFSLLPHISSPASSGLFKTLTNGGRSKSKSDRRRRRETRRGRRGQRKTEKDTETQIDKDRKREGKRMTQRDRETEETEKSTS